MCMQSAKKMCNYWLGHAWAHNQRKSPKLAETEKVFHKTAPKADESVLDMHNSSKNNLKLK